MTKRARRPSALPPLLGLLALLLTANTARPGGEPSPGADLRFETAGWTEHGEWKASGTVLPAAWTPGRPLAVKARLTVTEAHIASLGTEHNLAVDGLIVLVTAERTFDADGRFHQANDERMSTLLTPTGLAIEGGIQGACTSRFGYDWRTPVDLYQSVPLTATVPEAGSRRADFELATVLPADLPPGIYRVRLDFGFSSKGRLISLNGGLFASRPFFTGRPPESHLYSAPIPASGTHLSGRRVDGSSIQPRLYWVLLADYNSNGYRGVVAAEDAPYFALSSRNIIADDVILPRFNDSGGVIAYSLEPRFLPDTIEARSNIPWDFGSGQVTIVLDQPDGKTVLLGPSSFVGASGLWPTTNNPALTAWKPPLYGRYTAHVSGWIADVWGNRYTAGGTYSFWIAKRMTLATATFQGVPYPVGGRYGRDIGFAPPVPADVEVTATLFPYSDREAPVTIVSQGKATPGGTFGAAQGAQTLPLSSPGEYMGHVLATYTDSENHLWVSTMRHAGVVYPPDTTLVAHGKKLQIGSKFLDRGETRFEGYTEPDGDAHLVHITFPFLSGDVLLIASEQQGSNKIEPVLTYEDLAQPFAYDPAKLAGVGVSNIKIRTSNGLSPHMFPEYITEWSYYYGSAPRPGFMSRFLVGENGVRAPYWALSPNSFGGQINASANGDLAGDIYRLLGGVVVRRPGQPARYAGYMASGMVLPRLTNNNRVIAPGSEDIQGPTGEKARFHLVGLRPGMVYETGASFGAAVQIDPMLPADIRFTLQYPDGRTVEAAGPGDAFGTFAGKDRWSLDQPGVYRYRIEGWWNGFRGIMPGLPETGGEFYVIEKDRPAGAAGLTLDLANQSTFDASRVLVVTGRTTSALVHFAAAIPGCVVDQGTIVPKNGRFEYRFDPQAINRKAPTYDIINMTSGRPEIGKVVHLTFFARETAAQGQPYHSFARAILRGTRVYYAK